MCDSLHAERKYIHMSTSRKVGVPESPKEQVIVSQEDLQRLEAWIEFFRKMSPRISVMLTRDDDFGGFMERSACALRSRKLINENYEIVDWPKEGEVAFVIRIDSSVPGSAVRTCNADDAYFFCFDDLAFGLLYFEWDGDPGNDNWAETYSLASYSDHAVSWEYIASRIAEKVSELEDRVPPL